jgi:CheY-like chemotaxis protein
MNGTLLVVLHGATSNHRLNTHKYSCVVSVTARCVLRLDPLPHLVIHGNEVRHYLADEQARWHVAVCSLASVGIEPAAKVSGLAFCQRLRARTQVPILVLSSLDDKSFILDLYRAKVDDYIVKPISIQLLQAKLTVWQRWWSPAIQKVIYHATKWRHRSGKLQ